METEEKRDSSTQTGINFDAEPWKFRCNIAHFFSALGIIQIAEILLPLFGLFFLIEHMVDDETSNLKELLRVWIIITIVIRTFRIIPHLIIDYEKPLWMKHRMLYYDFVYSLVDAIFHLIPFLFILITNPKDVSRLFDLKIFFGCSFAVFFLHTLWSIYRLRKLRLEHGNYVLRIKKQDNVYVSYGKIFYVPF